MMIQDFLAQALTQRRDEGLYRQRRIYDGAQGVHLSVDGHSVINFCSNDYLGLAAHPALHSALHSHHCGTGAGASHLVCGHQRAHHDLETQLAEYTGRARALLFSSGYMANVGVISALLDRHDAVFLDRLNHASLVEGALLSRASIKRYRHNDRAHLELLLQQCTARHKLIVSDGVFSMDGDLAHVPDLVALAQRYEAWLMLDDAHGLGVIGAQGRGVIAHYSLNSEDVPILVGTLGKAFGVSGAFVAGSEQLIDYLIQHARTYIYTTAMPPALALAAQTALRVAEQESERRDHVQALSAYFRDLASAAGVPLLPSITPIQPVILHSNTRAMEVSQALYAQGFLVTAIRPPTVPPDSARLRITFSAAHQMAEVEALVTALQKLLVHSKTVPH
jgi:8-amino-7-oxononanoate synthase